MVKRIALVLLITLLGVDTYLAFHPLHHVQAQQIFDIPCPAGTTAINSMANPTNQHLKAYTCVDALGNVNSPTLTSIFPCGPTATCTTFNGPTIFPSGKQFISIGSAPLVSGTPSTVVITGLPFFSQPSYLCTGTNATNAANNLIKFTNSSGSSTTITGPASVTDVINYFCIGY